MQHVSCAQKHEERNKLNRIPLSSSNLKKKEQRKNEKTRQPGFYKVRFLTLALLVTVAVFWNKLQQQLRSEMQQWMTYSYTVTARCHIVFYL